MAGEVLVMGAAVLRNGRVLAARRTSPPEAQGRWELPGGKVRPGEDPDAAVVREVDEELGCRVAVIGRLRAEQPIRAGYLLQAATAVLVEGEPVPREHDALRWLGPEELEQVDWLAPDRAFLPELEQLLLDGEPLPGGNLGGAVRIGPTVRRATGPWTPSVHRLLAHLRAGGLTGVPEVLGTDARGREVLSYLPGTVADVDRDLLSDERLAALGAWTREFHDAVTGFEDPGPWRFATPPGAELVVHHDLAPYNVCFQGDRVSGVFGWDVAGPSTRLLDLAQLAWTSVPLFRERPPEVAAARLELLARAYGGVAATDVLDAVPLAEERALDGFRAREPAIRARLGRCGTIGS